MLSLMSFTFSRPPRFRGGLFIFLGLVGLGAPLCGQFKFREPPNRQQPEILENSTGEFLWAWFLQNRQVGPFHMEGFLSYRPSAAASVRYDFQLTGNWQGAYQETRMTLLGEEGSRIERQVIFQDGVHYRVRETGEGRELLPLDEAAFAEPVTGGLPFAWQDVLMPYLDWEGVQYLGPKRFLGRPAHQFEVRNPQKGGFPERVIVTLDEDYAALLQCDLIDASGFVAERMRVGGFRKFGEEWMFSELVWENRSDRSSVRLKLYSFRSTE